MYKLQLQLQLQTRRSVLLASLLYERRAPTREKLFYSEARTPRPALPRQLLIAPFLELEPSSFHLYNLGTPFFPHPSTKAFPSEREELPRSKA